MTLHASADALIEQIKRDHPCTPFIALGQTVLWDEPMKAVWRRLLDSSYPEAKLIAGIHDTDYFAKTTALVRDESPFVMLAHDDGATKGLWSAAGEMSALFGSEDLPTRAAYEKNGVPFNSLSADFHGSRRDFISDKTVAWGWRGIVDTGAYQKIAHDVKLTQILPALTEQLDWAFGGSISELAPEGRPRAQVFADLVKEWVKQIQQEEKDCRLSDLYEKLLPRFYESLLGAPPSNFDTTTSVKLFQFNKTTCSLPRFRFVDLFLNPSIGRICRSAYDLAVAGGGMYTLGAFGEGALPFDIVVPGKGRGTLHISGSSVTVDLPEDKLIADGGSAVTSVHELAAVLEMHLGPDIALVGKAVSLISMIASEFLIVFHETASGYSDRSTAMNDAIRKAGIALDLKPIVRIQYPTWDALSAAGSAAGFELPIHLARAFQTSSISAAGFATRWRTIVDEQQNRLAEMKSLRTPRSLIKYLEMAKDETKCWPCHLRLYDEAQLALTELAQKRGRLKGYISNLKRDRYAVKQAMQGIQQRMGEHYRSVIKPLQQELEQASRSADKRSVEIISGQIRVKESARRRHFDGRIARLNQLVRQMTHIMRQLRQELRKSEHSPAAMLARQIAKAAILDAQLARLEHVRAALITTTALPHTQARPSAWWLPLVDPSGEWFNAIAAGTTARLERL